MTSKIASTSCHVTVCMALALGLSACGTAPQQSQTSALSPDQITQITTAPDRTPADRNNDLHRKPEQTLAFIGVRPGMVALDLSTGGGYTAELLARAIGPTGLVVGQAAPRNPAARPPAAPEGNSSPGLAATPPASAAPSGDSAVPAPAAAPTGPRPPGVALAERAQRLRQAMVPAAPLLAAVQPFEAPVPASLADARLDLATLMFNYHDLGHMGVDRAAMNRAVFRALKPGGVYVIADHAGRPGTGISEAGTLHRIEEDFLKNEVEAAGFRWEASGDFLRNPNDPRNRNTPNPPQPKDEFVLKFVKP